MKNKRRCRPNILIITTHDSGTHFGCYGAQSVYTPSIDRLAAEGVKFTSMFASSSICSPSRGSLLTGMWPERNGLLGLSGPSFRYRLKRRDYHLSCVLADNGYRTALHGFQHEAVSDSDLGYESIIPLVEGGRRRSSIEVALVAADDIARRKRDDTPFFLQIGFHETHTPYLWEGLAPDRTSGTWVPPYTRYPDDDRELNEHIAAFQASIRRADEAVGIVLAALETGGLSEDTLVLFNTDHGPELPRAKWSMHDAGCRVAFIMRWPGGGVGGGRVCDTLLSNVDFVPTLTDLVDLDVSHETDGVSFSSQFGDEPKATRDAVFCSFAYDGNWAVRTRRHKLIRSFNATMHNGERFREDSRVPPLLLFDLENDPYETTNLAGKSEYRALRDELDSMLWEYLESTESPILGGAIEHPVVAELRSEYETNRGRWSNVADSSVDVEELREDAGKYTVTTERFRLAVDFSGISRPRAVKLFDLAADPTCELNVADDPGHADAYRAMSAHLWAWLERTEDPIRYRSETSAQHAQALAEYRTWKDTR